MKKFAILALTLVLATGLLTACRGSNTTDSTGSTGSTGTSTPATTAPTVATTVPTTAPNTPSTNASTDGGMLEDGKIDGNGDAGSKSGRNNLLP